MYQWITVILLFSLYLCVIFYTINYNKLFQPTKNISQFEIEPSNELLIDGIWVSHFEFTKTGPTILFCHGNSGNLSNRNYMVKLCKMSNMNLIMFDYSGYGKSNGMPRTRRLLNDGEKVLEWASSRVEQDKLIIWGESLGGSVASYLASKNKCKKLVLFATFASLNDLAFGEEYSWWKLPIQSFLNLFVHPLPTKSWVKESNVPTLVVHSKDDELISVKHARMLKEIDSERIFLREIEGGHGTPKLTKEDLDIIFNFCGVNDFSDHETCLRIFDTVNQEIWKE
jgi:predicted alpha/beta-fold hydrolase